MVESPMNIGTPYFILLVSYSFAVVNPKTA